MDSEEQPIKIDLSWINKETLKKYYPLLFLFFGVAAIFFVMGYYSGFNEAANQIGVKLNNCLIWR